MATPVAIDKESALFTAAKAVPPAVVVSYTCSATAGDEHILHARFDRKSYHYLLGWALTTRDVVWVGAHAAFDLSVSVNEFPDLWPLVFDAYEQDRVYDVLHGQKLIDIANDDYFRNKGQYNLESLARRHLKVQLEKDSWRTLYGKFLDVPLDRFEERARELRPDLDPRGVIDYPKKDVRTPYDIAAIQWRSPNLLKDAYRQCRAAWWMHLMATWGFRTDPVWVAELRKRYEKERDELAYVLRAHGLVRADGTKNTKAAQARMVEVCRAKGIAVKMTEGGESEDSEPGIALDEDACLVSGDEVLKTYARFTSIANVCNKDVPALSRPLIQSSFEVLVETGRTSSSGGKGKGKKRKALDGYQLQNVKKEPGIRESFVPRDGCYLLSVDYGQVELHAWAQVCLKLIGFSRLAELLNAKMDVHMLLGCRVAGFDDYELAVKHKKEKPYKDWRQGGKALAFGGPGGLGWRSLKEYARMTYGVIWDDSEAQAAHGFWKQTLPEAQPYFDYVKRVVGAERNYGTVEQLFSGRLRGGTHFTNACNSYFQGLAADCAKDAGFRVSKACYVDRSSPLYGSRIINFVHDELVVEVPIHLAHAAAEETVSLMEAAGRVWMPDVPPRAEPALMKRWAKDAAPKYDENKRLIPWEPEKPVWS